jgi:hypothetical protein
VGILENQLLKVLRGEGLTDLELIALATNSKSWDDRRASGWDEVEIPILIDTDGVFYIYSADSNDIILIDKKGRLVTKEFFSPDLEYESGALEKFLQGLRQRIRELHAE